MADIQSGASNLGKIYITRRGSTASLQKRERRRKRYGVHVRESVWIVGSKAMIRSST